MKISDKQKQYLLEYGWQKLPNGNYVHLFSSYEMTFSEAISLNQRWIELGDYEIDPDQPNAWNKLN